MFTADSIIDHAVIDMQYWQCNIASLDLSNLANDVTFKNINKLALSCNTCFHFHVTQAHRLFQREEDTHGFGPCVIVNMYLYMSVHSPPSPTVPGGAGHPLKQTGGGGTEAF